MKKNIYKKNLLFTVAAAIAPNIFTVVVFLLVISGLNQTERSNREEARTALENGIRRAVITCYAIEGSYPENISYIEKHYGLRIDKNKYFVHYEVFAQNLLPEITVIARVDKNDKE